MPEEDHDNIQIGLFSEIKQGISQVRRLADWRATHLNT